VFLRALTLKGFKSFADKTTLEFEPGVTVVVGPNGSGKSNLVDAVAWVLGAQGARSLRGGKMDDVIFAGTPDRPAPLRTISATGALVVDSSSTSRSRHSSISLRRSSSDVAVSFERAAASSAVARSK